MIKTCQEKRALLIGNGINQLDSNLSFSWKKLLDELKTNDIINIDLNNIFKPFPLAFDEILHQKSSESTIKILKQKISKTIIEKQLSNTKCYNEYHEKISKLNYADILTTNYDYSLENSICNNFLIEKDKLAINKQEIKYSLKRGYKLYNKKIWHIHGELFDSRTYLKETKNYKEKSILIGYQHYSSYLEQIQKIIKGKSGAQSIEKQSLRNRLKNKSLSPFWIDKLFTHNIDIIGFGFDFSENHLWWLINYRANMKRRKNSKNGISINNKIRFFYPKINGNDSVNIQKLIDVDKILKKKNEFMKLKAISELLKSFDIEPKEIKCNSYRDFYDKFIEKNNRKHMHI